MTQSHPIRWTLAVAAALFSVAVRAQVPCGPTPEKYRGLEFGDTRFAVEEDCRHTFTQAEQFFLAGVAQRLLTACKRPRAAEDREAMERFTKAAALSLALREREGPLRAGDRASAFAAGTSMMDELRCDGPEAALLARGIAIYLKRTSKRSRFVPGCVELYAPRYGEEECRCIADAIRPGLPEVDDRFFDRELVKERIDRSPRVALTLMFSCGVQKY